MTFTGTHGFLALQSHFRFVKQLPLQTQRNKHVIIMSKRRFDTIITCNYVAPNKDSGVS